MNHAFKMTAVLLVLGILVLQGCQTTVSNFNKYSKYSYSTVCENVRNNNGYHWNREASNRGLVCLSAYETQMKLINDYSVCENVRNNNGYHWNREATLRNLDCGTYEANQKDKNFTHSNYTQYSDKDVCENVRNNNGYHWNREASNRGLNCEIYKFKPKPIKKKKQEPKINEDTNKLYKVNSGSGFAVSSDGHIVTNNHVIKSCQRVKVHILGKKYISEIISNDKKNDLALLKIDYEPKFVFPISKTPPELMQEVYVAGFPFGYRLSTRIKVTKGIISSLAGLGDDFTRVQVDAAIQPGNSGGPIYDKFGNIIAVAVAKLDYKYSIKEFNSIPELTNFGIKSSMLNSFLSASNVNTKPFVTTKTPNLSQAIQDATYYVSCLMTMARYKEMKSKKVLFNEDQVSLEETIK